MNSIRIFVDAHQFDHGFDGAASFIQGLYSALVRQRPGEFSIYLGCSNPERVIGSFENNQHFKIVKYGSDNRIRRLTYDIPQAIARIRPNFAHFQYFTPLIKSCPWIVTIHDVLFNDFPQYFPPGYARIRNILFPLSARRADLLTTVSPYSKGRIAAWYNIDLGRINVIPNGVNTKRSKETTPSSPSPRVETLIRSSAKYVLCVSRFEPRKNQVTLLRAFVEGGFWTQGLSLVFVGSRTLISGDFDAAFAAVPAAAKERIVFLQDLAYADVRRLYAHAVAAVYPSLAEGFGMPPLEAAVEGIPSLCARNTAMSDFTPISPYFFDASDRLGLIHKLREVVEHHDAHLKLARHIAVDVQKLYAWDAAALEFGRLIDDFRTRR